jgi:hypothetical protein
MSSSANTNTHTTAVANTVNTPTVSLSTIFTGKNLLIFIIILAIYGVLYYVIHSYNKGANPMGTQLALSRSIDVFICIIILVGTILWYMSLTEYEKSHLVVYNVKFFKEFFDTPNVTLYILGGTLIFYLLIYICQVPMTKDTKPKTILFIEYHIWVVLAIQIILVGLNYLFGFHLIDWLFSDKLIDWLGTIKNPEVDDIIRLKSSKDEPGKTSETTDRSGVSEVFNV